MKTLSRLFALTSVSLFTALIPASHAAPLSPAGDWDFVMAGKQRGIALVTFDPGYTLFGSEIFRPAPAANASTSSGDARHPVDYVAARKPSDVSTNSSSSSTATNFYGSAQLEGFWTYDSSGRIIGAINELYYSLELVTRSYTNVVDMTNQITTVTMLENVKHTNGISFRGVLGTSGKLILNIYTPRGPSTLTGVRMAALPDYSGNYYGVAAKEHPYVEFFSTSPNGLASSGYDVLNGFGAGYSFDGSMYVSKQKQVALYAMTEYGVLTVCTGPYKTNRFTGANAITGDLRGTDGTRSNFSYKLAPRP